MAQLLQGDAAIAAAALACESDLPQLQLDAQRRHIHYTHVRTHNPQDRQPATMTREEVWEVLCDCYRIAYPSTAQGATTGSILLFGMVVKERHQNDSVEEHRDEHHHIATFASCRHYWRKIKKVAAQKHHVQLHAVCHDGYSSMYYYLRAASERKPLSELDSNYWLSPAHPSGEALQNILAEGERLGKCRAARVHKKSEDLKLPIFAAFFNQVVDNGLRGKEGATQIQALAVEQLV